MASTPDAAGGLSDDQIQYYLRLIFARNDARVARLNQADWVDLTPRSALVGDDRATQPYQLSHAVCSGIADAVEQLHALSTLLRDANTLHPSAPLVLARCAIESASNAAWMLTPRSRAERVRRRMVLHVLDIEDSAKATTEAELEPPRTKAERLMQAQQIADAAHGGTATNLKDQGSRTATSRIRQVALDVDSDFSILLAWMVGSGFAHGRPWAPCPCWRPSNRSNSAMAYYSDGAPALSKASCGLQEQPTSSSHTPSVSSPSAARRDPTPTPAPGATPTIRPRPGCRS